MYIRVYIFIYIYIIIIMPPDGDLFSWGHNGYCQLGNGSSNQGIQPVSISQYISHQVVRVACGSHHSLALTKDGEVSRCSCCGDKVGGRR